MNDLNSLLIEGVTINEPVLRDDACQFTISVTHTSHRGVKTVMSLEVVLKGLLGRNTYEYLGKSHAVRIVGRLALKDKKIVVEGEHIEMRPKRKEERVA